MMSLPSEPRRSAYQNLVLHRHPHELEKGLGLLGRQDVISVNPHSVGLRSAVLSIEFTGNGARGSRAVDVQTLRSIDTETVQETVGTTHGLEVAKTLGVNQGSENERLLEEGSGVGGVVGRVDVSGSPSLFDVDNVVLVLVLVILVLLSLAEKTLELGHGRSLRRRSGSQVVSGGVDVPVLLILLAGR